MNYQWMNQAAACPIVEFHDIRTEKFKSDRYLALLEDRLAAPLVAAGGRRSGAVPGRRAPRPAGAAARLCQHAGAAARR